MITPAYRGFLGIWVLDPDSCEYAQGDPPKSGECEIQETESGIRFVMRWTDAAGESHEHALSGVPDGVARPFAGGDLADALVVRAPSHRELTSAALWKGKERMVAQRQLDESGQAMRLTQLVRLPDGERLANVSIYRKRVPPEGPN